MKGVDFLPTSNNISDYNIIGTLTESKSFSAWICNTPKLANSSQLYLINRFPHTPANQATFKDFFSYYSTEGHTKDISNFFSSQNYFYIVCKYYKGEKIENVFEPTKNTANYDKRCQVLNDILVKLSNVSDLSLPALICLSNIDNICIDTEGNVQFIYNFEKIPDPKNATQAMLFNNISLIIQILLRKELKDRYSHALRIVLEKCNNQLYKSIPHLIVDLKKAEKKYLTSNFSTYIKRTISKYKKQIKKFSWIGGVVIGVCAAGIFVNQYLTNKNNQNSQNAVVVGNIKYSTASGTNNTEIQPHEIASRPETSTPIDFTIPQNADIPSEDYVVQAGDTLESICANNYSSPDFVSAIQSFNNISSAQLVAGTIIKLPDETAVKDYVLYQK